MTEETRALVRRRAGGCCEYCGLRQEDSPLAILHIEHIRPRKHGGDDHESNLCLACIDCNLHKGPNLTGIEPDPGVITELFNPRRQKWDDHFEFVDVYLLGKTAIGRTTIQVQRINSEDQLALPSAS